MIDKFFQYKIGQICQAVDFSEEDRKQCELTLKDFKITPAEDFLLSRTVAPDLNSGKDVMLVYGTLLDAVRGNRSHDIDWLDVDKLSKLQITTEVLADQNFFDSTLRAINFWHTGGHFFQAYEFLKKMEEVTLGDFMFDKVEPPLSLMYKNLCLILLVAYYEYLPLSWEMSVLNSRLLIDAVLNGLDVESAIARNIDSLLLLESRRELAIDSATFILTNKYGIVLEGGNTVTLPEVIKSFKLHSNNQFDSVSLIAFMDDKFWQNWLLDKKMAVRYILTIYGNLLRDTYVFPYEDDILETQKIITKEKQEKFYKQNDVADLKKSIVNDFNKKFILDENGIYKDTETVLKKLNELAVTYNNPSIADWYYYDANEGKFKWGI